MINKAARSVISSLYIGHTCRPSTSPLLLKRLLCRNTSASSWIFPDFDSRSTGRAFAYFTLQRLFWSSIIQGYILGLEASLSTGCEVRMHTRPRESYLPALPSVPSLTSELTIESPDVSPEYKLRSSTYHSYAASISQSPSTYYASTGVCFSPNSPP